MKRAALSSSLLMLALVIGFGCGRSDPPSKQTSGGSDASLKKVIIAEDDAPGKKTDKGVSVRKNKEIPVLSAPDTITVEVNKELDGNDLSEGIGLACSHDGRFLCAAGGFQMPGGISKVRLINVAGKKEIAAAEGVSFYSTSVVMAKDASWAAFLVRNGLELWEFPAAKSVRRFKGHSPSRLVTSPDRELILALVRGGIAGWNPSKEEPLFDNELEPAPMACACLPDKSQIAVWHVDGSVRIWDTKSWQTVKSFPLEKQSNYRTSRLAASPDGNFLAVGDAMSPKLRVINCKTTKVRELDVGSGLDEFQFLPGSNWLVYRKSSFENGDLTIHDVETGEERAILRGHQKDLANGRSNVIWGMASSADGATFFTACGRGEIKIWNLKKLKS